MRSDERGLRLVVVVVCRGDSAGSGLRYGVKEVVGRVAAKLQREHRAVRLDVSFVVPEEVADLARTPIGCVGAIVDVSVLNAEVGLCMGRLLGSGVPVIPVAASGVGSGAGLRTWGRRAVVYSSLEELFERDGRLETEIFRAIPETRIQEELVYGFWFPRDTSTIWVVCPKDHEPGEYADERNPDYTYLDNLGDQDALVEQMVFLSSRYPHATIEYFSAEDIPSRHTSGNLVVIGGPGSTASISNRICAEMMRAIGSRVRYSADCEEMLVERDDRGPLKLEAEYESSAGREAEERGLRRDVGYFARFPNPLNEEAVVVLVNGLHTSGVRGATRIFGDRRECLRNFYAVLDVGGSMGGSVGAFECYFDVGLLGGNVQVPQVRGEDVFTVSQDREKDVTSGRVVASDGASSATILFVAGDRGGSRQNQIQMPNEYGAIQDALRASEYRNSIALAPPILAATRERLAHAYRQRATVFHFVGHGDERSLAIIEDNQLLVGEAELTAEELKGVLMSMEGIKVTLCVLNACESAALAGEIVDAGVVQYAIGWPKTVSDSTAIAFSRGLYGALGDGGTVREAFEVGRGACGADEGPMIRQGNTVGDVALVERRGGRDGVDA